MQTETERSNAGAQLAVLVVRRFRRPVALWDAWMDAASWGLLIDRLPWGAGRPLAAARLAGRLVRGGGSVGAAMMTTAPVVDRRLAPLMEPQHDAPAKASDLTVEPHAPVDLIRFNAAWHSRLPHVQRGPWRLAFVSHYRYTVFAVAFWHNPSARGLPQDWLELRRMAVAPDAPHCTASHMLGRMRRQIRTLLPEVTRLISYQDQDVHTGIIYRAAGWTPAWVTKARVRDRSGYRRGTTRAYRSDANGLAPAASAKTRWEITP